MKKRTDKYLRLLEDSNTLIKSCQSIIKRKKSILAIKIKKRDMNAIYLAAQSKFYGALSDVEKKQVCKAFEDFNTKRNNKTPGESLRETKRELIQDIIGIIPPRRELTISLLVIIKFNRKYKVCCKN